MERQNNSTLKIANKETSSIQTIWKKDDMIDIEREKGIIMKEIEDERQKDYLIDLINNRKRKQKDITMKLIDNLLNHLKDKKKTIY